MVPPPKTLMKRGTMRRTIEIELQLQQPIDKVPERYGDPYKQACSGDQVTVNTWKDIWIKNFKASKERFKEIGERSYGKLHGVNRQRPAIVCGSGPSLKNSIPALIKNRQSKNPVMTVSCLHNFGYFEDEGCHADYYLSLDAGDIVLKDVWEGRKSDPDVYWEATKGKVLLANVASPPELFDMWQGEIYLFSCIMPDLSLRQEFDKIEKFTHYISSGGNALGGCVYAAKSVMGSGEIIIVGGDFCFGYTHNFHSYPTSYDNKDGNGIGQVVRWPDVYGLPRVTWPSYLNFKFWFDWLTLTIPGRWVSASEGIFGSYPEGNLRSILYGSLDSILETYQMVDRVEVGNFEIINGQRVNAVDENGKVIKTPHFLEDFWKDPKQPMEMTLF